MRPLSYVRVGGVDTAIATVAVRQTSAFLAGGTTEIDLVRLGVTAPDLLVDIDALPLADIEDQPGGGLRVGALARMTGVARDGRVVRDYPGVSRSLLLGASAQLRDVASIGGNLCERVRCAYFCDGVAPVIGRAGLALIFKLLDGEVIANLAWLKQRPETAPSGDTPFVAGLAHARWPQDQADDEGGIR